MSDWLNWKKKQTSQGAHTEDGGTGWYERYRSASCGTGDYMGHVYLVVKTAGVSGCR